jgi:transposase
VAEREVYAALDWLLEQQPRVESALARRHLKNGTLVLYDVSSSYLEGRKCPLAQHGYSRDHRPDRLQIVYGLLCSARACRWPWRCSTAIRPTRRPSPPRSRS